MKVFIIYNIFSKKILGKYRSRVDAERHPSWGLRNGTHIKDIEVEESIDLPTDEVVRKLIFNE